MSGHLATHEWDKFGDPPPPGPDYREAGLVSELLNLAEALRQITELYDDAEYAREEADRAEDKARGHEKAINADLARLRETHPRAIKAIEEDPYRYAKPQEIAALLTETTPPGLIG